MQSDAIQCPPFGLGPFLSVVLALATVGCVPTLRWVPDAHQPPSCLPDRLIRWSDFVPRNARDTRAAETAVKFNIDHRHRRLFVIFDPVHSWVRPELVDPHAPLHRRMSEQLLAHEQVHYLLSCLVVRQANQSIVPRDNLYDKLSSVESKAQRLNVQYDADTQHGTRPEEQDSWQKKVMEQLADLVPPTENSDW